MGMGYSSKYHSCARLFLDSYRSPGHVLLYFILLVCWYVAMKLLGGGSLSDVCII